MEKELGIICAEGFSFFGNTNRLISHELKNILAIISETLGLSDELMELNERGVKMKPGKLRSLNASVIEEVDRANLIIRNMNTLAHSVDRGIEELDINQMAALIIKISQLNPSLRNTEISLQETEPCHVHSNPFFLMTLFHHAMNMRLPVMNCGIATGPNRVIGLAGLTPAGLWPSRPLQQSQRLDQPAGKNEFHIQSAGQAETSTVLSGRIRSVPE